MIVDTKQDIVETNVAQARQFSVTENSSKLFSLLSTVLYTNKELAVIHENCANAYDEQKESGNGSVPITVIAPTTLEPVFAVRDIGRGLSEENVYRLLTTYGESTKNKSNSSIGGWGVGFKSSAAVTDNWTVISNHGGIRKEYLIFVDSHGIPSITKLSESDTTETGLEVRIPVNPSRISIWHNAIRQAFIHYEVRPEIKNLSVFWPNYEPHVTTDSWSFGNLPNDACGIVTSNRLYAVDRNTVRGEFNGKDFTRVLNWPIQIKANIGDVDMSLSRESMQYTRRTYDYLERVYTGIYDHFYAKVKDILSQATGGIHFRQLCHEVRSSVFHVDYSSDYDAFILNVIVNEFPQYGITGNLSNEISHVSFVMKCETVTTAGRQHINGHALVTPITAIRGSSLSVRKIDSNFYSWGDDHVRYSTSDQKLRIKLSRLHAITFVINDVGRPCNAIVRHNLRNGLLKKCAVALVSTEFDFIPDDMKQYVVKASSLHPVPKAAAQPAAPKARYSKSDVYQIRQGKFVRLSDDTDIEKLTGLYVNTRGFTSIDMLVSTTDEDVRTLIDLASRVGHSVYAVRTGKPAPNSLSPLRDVLVQKARELKGANVIETLKHLMTVQGVNTNHRYAIGVLIKNKVKTGKASIWNDFVDQYANYDSAKYSEAYSACALYCDLTRAIKDKNLPVAEMPSYAECVDAAINKLYNTYTMLKYIDTNNRTATAEFCDAVRVYLESVKK